MGTFKIIKKGNGNFWHIFNNSSKEVNLSDFEIVLDSISQTFSISMLNGANIPQTSVNITDIIVIDQTDGSIEETFANVDALRVRLVALNYTPYIVSGGGGGLQTLGQTLLNGNSTDGENIDLSEGDAIVMHNGSRLKAGSVDNGYGGGISRICVAEYENEWENGVDYYFPLGGAYVYAKSINGVVPNSSFDNTKKWQVGSFYYLLNENKLYKCTDATTGGAVWELQSSGSQNLQQVTDVGNETTNPLKAASFQFYDSVNGVWNKLEGIESGWQITNDEGVVIASGQNDNITIGAVSSNKQAVISTDLLTGNRLHKLPNASGTLALTGDIPDVSGKEDSSNKVTTFTGNETSTTKFPVVKAIIDYFTASNIRSILGITTLSGSNTGDQDLSGLIIKNTAITGATKTKITYDSKGLVTAGADATTVDIADSTNKRYVTDAQLVVIGNTSGTNTGDETLSSIQSKLVSTTNLSEGTNLYFTTARVLATALSGLSLATGGAIVSTDSVLVAFGKIQKQINDLSTVYQAILTSTNFGTFMNGLPAKNTLVDADEVVSDDSADSSKAKKTTWLNVWTNYIKVKTDALYQVILTEVNFGTFLNGLTAKTTPVDADTINIVDSADSNKSKKVTLTNFKAFLKTYFDTLYQPRVSFKLTDTVPSSDLTGTTTETVMKSYTIASNSFAIGDFFNVKLHINYTTAAAGSTRIQYLKVSNTNNYATANTVLQNQNSSANNYALLRNSLYFVSGNILRTVTSETSRTIDNGSFAVQPVDYSIDPTQPIYVWVGMKNPNTTDVGKFLSLSITN